MRLSMIIMFLFLTLTIPIRALYMFSGMKLIEDGQPITAILNVCSFGSYVVCFPSYWWPYIVRNKVDVAPPEPSKFYRAVVILVGAVVFHNYKDVLLGKDTYQGYIWACSFAFIEVGSNAWGFLPSWIYKGMSSLLKLSIIVLLLSEANKYRIIDGLVISSILCYETITWRGYIREGKQPRETTEDERGEQNSTSPTPHNGGEQRAINP